MAVTPQRFSCPTLFHHWLVLVPATSTVECGVSQSGGTKVKWLTIIARLILSIISTGINCKQSVSHCVYVRIDVIIGALPLQTRILLEWRAKQSFEFAEVDIPYDFYIYTDTLLLHSTILFGVDNKRRHC